LPCCQANHGKIHWCAPHFPIAHRALLPLSEKLLAIMRYPPLKYRAKHKIFQLIFVLEQMIAERTPGKHFQIFRIDLLAALRTEFACKQKRFIRVIFHFHTVQYLRRIEKSGFLRYFMLRL
jgi:hypothetical protein